MFFPTRLRTAKLWQKQICIYECVHTNSILFTSDIRKQAVCLYSELSDLNASNDWTVNTGRLLIKNCLKISNIFKISHKGIENICLQKYVFPNSKWANRFYSENKWNWMSWKFKKWGICLHEGHALYLFFYLTMQLLCYRKNTRNGKKKCNQSLKYLSLSVFLT